VIPLASNGILEKDVIIIAGSNNITAQLGTPIAPRFLMNNLTFGYSDTEVINPNATERGSYYLNTTDGLMHFFNGSTFQPTNVSSPGNLAVGGTLTVGGASTLAGVTAASVAVTGNETVGGTLTVTGNETVNGAITATGLVVNSSAAFLMNAAAVSTNLVNFYVGQSNTTNNLVRYGLLMGTSPALNKGAIGWVSNPNNSATFDVSGNWILQGSITATAKNFLIPHPDDDTKTLLHSCLEGAEYAVFYRGESITSGGSVLVTLPEYFESLVRPENRSILLTQIADFNGPSTLAVSRIVDGQFTVFSSGDVAAFFWEVKGVRSDQEELEVIKDKE
jgi:hypothetical protein